VHCEFNSIRCIAAFLVLLGILQFIEWVNEQVILFDVKWVIFQDGKTETILTLLNDDDRATPTSS
jgi:hypothetical protein